MRAVAALALIVLLAGCTGGSDAEPAASPTPGRPPLPSADDPAWRTGVFVALPLDAFVLSGRDAATPT